MDIDYAESQRPQPGSGIFPEFARLYGSIDVEKLERRDLNFYRYEGKLNEIINLMEGMGYKFYLAGGRFPKPNFGEKNYLTKHLMVYDPLDQNGRIAFCEQYAISYSILHELAHALTLDKLNGMYGNGKRLGKLGENLSRRECLRALHWEIMALPVQRELSEKVGVHMKEDDYQRDRNGVLAEATMRAVTGRFSEPNNEGFFPHCEYVDIEKSLAVIHEYADKLGLGRMALS